MDKFKIDIKVDKEKNINTADVKVPKETFEKYQNEVADHYVKTSKIQGFRKGAAPRNIVEKTYAQQISKESINHLLREIILHISKLEDEKKPDPREEIKITDIKQDEDEVNVKLEYIPFSPPVLAEPEDVLDIKTKITENDEKEFEEFVKETLIELYQKAIKKELTEEDKKLDLQKLYDKVFDVKEIKESNKEITDLKTLKEKLKPSFESKRENFFVSNLVEEIYNQLLEKSKIRKPEKEVEAELQNRAENYLKRFKDVGIDPEEFLKKEYSMSLEDLKKDWRPEVEKGVTRQIFLFEYAQKHNLTPNDEQVKVFIEKNKEQLTNNSVSTKFEDMQRVARNFLIIKEAEMLIMRKALEEAKSFSEEEKKIAEKYLLPKE